MRPVLKNVVISWESSIQQASPQGHKRVVIQICSVWNVSILYRITVPYVLDFGCTSDKTATNSSYALQRIFFFTNTCDALALIRGQWGGADEVHDIRKWRGAWSIIEFWNCNWIPSREGNRSATRLYHKKIYGGESIASERMFVSIADGLAKRYYMHGGNGFLAHMNLCDLPKWTKSMYRK